MNNKEPLVSILVPTYNSGKYLQKTLESLLKQTYENIEIVIVDNCSEDNTKNIIDSFFDKRIRFFRNSTNIGMANNWNECIKKANGKYGHFCCADDYLEQNCIAEKLKIMNMNESIALITNSTNIVDENDKLLYKRKSMCNIEAIDGYKFSLMSFRYKNIYGEPSNVLFDLEKAKKNGIKFNSNLIYAVDWDFWLRYSQCGSVISIPDFLVNYRVSRDNETSKMSIKKIIDDDRRMIENLKNSNFKINTTDILIHKLMIRVRAIVRALYMLSIK